MFTTMTITHLVRPIHMGKDKIYLAQVMEKYPDATPYISGHDFDQEHQLEHVFIPTHALSTPALATAFLRDMRFTVEEVVDGKAKPLSKEETWKIRDKLVNQIVEEAKPA